MAVKGSNHKGKSKNTTRKNKGKSKNTTRKKRALSDTNTNKAKRNAISRSGVVLDEPGITWETLTKSPYAQQFTHKDQEYIFIHSEEISKKTVARPAVFRKNSNTNNSNTNNSKPYTIPELYITYKDDLEKFCNDTFPVKLIEYYMGEREFQLYFILRNDTNTGTVVIEAFMTFHIYQEHVGGSKYDNLELGTICVAPKRSGLGRKCIELLQEMVEDERLRLDYLFLTPATGAAGFYKGLGFRMYEPENENGNEKHTYMIWCRPGATDPLCSMKNNANTPMIMPTT